MGIRKKPEGTYDAILRIKTYHRNERRRRNLPACFHVLIRCSFVRSLVRSMSKASSFVAVSLVQMLRAKEGGRGNQFDFDWSMKTLRISNIFQSNDNRFSSYEKCCQSK